MRGILDGMVWRSDTGKAGDSIHTLNHSEVLQRSQVWLQGATPKKGTRAMAGSTSLIVMLDVDEKGTYSIRTLDGKQALPFPGR